MVNLVIVSHSARLGEGVGELARQMLSGKGCQLAIAAGIDDPDSPIGTDPLKVMAAIESVAGADHVLVMMDIGSALLSAETALDLLEPQIAEKVRLCAAPLVEGSLAAAVSADAGADIDKVIADAMQALEAKRVQLGLPAGDAASPAAQRRPAADEDARAVSVTIKNRNGLHVRPASKLVTALSGFNARLMLEKEGRCVTPDSINQIALLQVRCGDRIRLLASGPDADAALAAFQALAAQHFGEDPDAAPGAALPAAVADARGRAVMLALPHEVLPGGTADDPAREQQQLKQAINATLADLTTLAAQAEEKYSPDIAAIFSGHHTLLDDPELFDEACHLIHQQQLCAGRAWQQVMSGLSQQYRQLDDGYLQARYIDIDDILHRSLRHLRAEAENPLSVAGPAIIVSDDIYPSTVLRLDPQQIKGICLRRGSDLSHGAIIARAAGIAFLSQQGEAVDALRLGETLTLEMTAKRLRQG